MKVVILTGAVLAAFVLNTATAIFLCDATLHPKHKVLNETIQAAAAGIAQRAKASKETIAPAQRDLPPCCFSTITPCWRPTRVPVMLIHGMEDFNIPLRHCEAILKNHAGVMDLWQLPGASHTGLTEPRRRNLSAG